MGIYDSLQPKMSARPAPLLPADAVFPAAVWHEHSSAQKRLQSLRGVTTLRADPALLSAVLSQAAPDTVRCSMTIDTSPRQQAWHRQPVKV